METGQRVVVVGAAIVRRGTVLAAQRGHPPELAGRWELPGGKVEPGEDERTALVRECREELGIDIEVGARLGPELPTADGEFLLRAYLCELTERSALPRSTEHKALKWAGPAELRRLRWLDADRPLVPALEAALQGRTATVTEGLLDLDEAPPPEPLRRRGRHLLHPLRPLVALTAAALVALGLAQSAVLASGAAEPSAKTDGTAQLARALLPPPLTETARPLLFVPGGLLPQPSTCRASGLLPRGTGLVQASFGDPGSTDSTDVVLALYPDTRTARNALQSVRAAVARTCRTLRPQSLSTGSAVEATYDDPRTVAHGFEVAYRGTSTLRDSGSGSTADSTYVVTGDIVMLQQGPFVVEVADGAFNDQADSPGPGGQRHHPLPLAQVLLERLVHPE